MQLLPLIHLSIPHHRHLPLIRRYSSWRNSNTQLWVLDEKLRVVVWSKGLARMCGFDPVAGTPLTSFPFVSDEKRARMIRSLNHLDPRHGPLLPVYALVSLNND